MNFDNELARVRSLNTKAELKDYIRSNPNSSVSRHVDLRRKPDITKAQIITNIEDTKRFYDLINQYQAQPPVFPPLIPDYEPVGPPPQKHNKKLKQQLKQQQQQEEEQEEEEQQEEQEQIQLPDKRRFYSNNMGDILLLSISIINLSKSKVNNKKEKYLTYGIFNIYVEEYDPKLKITIGHIERKKEDYKENHLSNIISYYEDLVNYLTFPYIKWVEIIRFPQEENPLEFINYQLENLYVRDSSNPIKGVDIGYKLPTLDFSLAPGLCGPGILANVLKDSRATFSDKPNTKHTPKVTLERIIKAIDEKRGQILDPFIGYTVKEMGYVAELANMKFFYVINSFGELIYKYNAENPDHKKKYNPGCICMCNSLHFSLVQENTAPGITPDDLLPKFISFKDAAVHFSLSETAVEGKKNAYYLPFPVNDFAIKYLKDTRIAPNIISIDKDSKEISAFSVGHTLYKYVENMDITLPWLESLGLPFNGQSLSSLTYEYWKKAVGKCSTSPLFYSEMQHHFPYCHTGTFDSRLKKIYKKNPNKTADELFVAVDCTKCFTSCIENNLYGRFDNSDEIEPYNPNMPIHPQGFYYTSNMQGMIKGSYWPHFGPGFWYIGAAIKEYQKYPQMKVEIMAQIIPSSIYPPNELSDAIREIYNRGGKLACNALIGMLTNTSKTEAEKNILTSSLEEVAYYLSTREKATASVIEIGDQKVFRITEFLNSRPVYENYLPIAKSCHQYASLALFKEVMALNALDALVGVHIDCLIFDKSKVVLNLPQKGDVKERGVFVIEPNVSLAGKNLKKKYISPVRIPPYPQYNTFTEMPLDKSIFCNAPGGMGKSNVLMDFIQKLRAKGYNPLITGATWVSALNISKDAISADQALGLSIITSEVKNKPKINSSHTHLIIDEFYFLSTRVQNALMKLRQSNPKLHIILFGCNIQMSVGSRTLPSKSSYMATVCHANRLMLTHNYRFEKSPELGKLCNEYVDHYENGASAPDLSKYNLGCDDKDLAITATNKTADEINKYWTNYYMPVDARLYLYPGIPLIKKIRSTNEGEIVMNGQFFMIRQVTPVIILEYSNINREGLDRYITISDSDMSQYKKAWAITCHSAQGSTIEIPYTIYELKLAQFKAQRNADWKYWEYVAISRARKIELINVKDCFNLCMESEPMDPDLYLL